MLPLVRWYGARRTRMTSKQGTKYYFKGSGTGSMGHWAKHGTYVPDLEKQRVFVVPASLASTPVYIYLSIFDHHHSDS